MAIETKTISVTDEDPGRVDLVVRDVLKLSRSKLRGLFDHGCVSINDQSCLDVSMRLKQGDVVTVEFDPHQGYREKKRPWSDRTFSVIFEDDEIIVVNKSATVLTVATDVGEEDTLVNRVSRYLKHTSSRRDAYLVHRLDRDVSGLLVFAKNPVAMKNLQQQFKARRPERVYIGIIYGNLEEPEGTFESFLATGDNLSRYSTLNEKEGELAITHYKVQKAFDDASLVEIQMETGRRGQIRVHFAEAGHPLLGDPRYGSRKRIRHDRWKRKYPALHSSRLGFDHPVTGEPMMFESPLPGIMQKFIRGSRPAIQ